jgi:hypothetical protein
MDENPYEAPESQDRATLKQSSADERKKRGVSGRIIVSTVLLLAILAVAAFVGFLGWVFSQGFIRRD